MSAGRAPPNLSYLAIYNPTLQPNLPTSVDDEDAEEQAQILFYTSKERAVSRDRMLRQIGLAKALVNFSEQFSSDDTCDSVHSQTRRMIMVSPEPDFWIHAGIELAKAPRTSVQASKSKGKPKSGKGTSSDKNKAKEPANAIYQYSDASVHNSALKEDILRGYERFKLTHGSFTSILSRLGQQALELQLERFFTVWAWSWNLEEGYEFGDHLGVTLYSSYHSVIPVLDTFSTDIGDSVIPIALTSTCVIPSTRFTKAGFPPSVTRHLLTLVPPSPSIRPSSPSTPSTSAEGRVRRKRPPDHKEINAKGESSAQTPTNGTFMGIPSMNLNMNVNLDVRKWSWPDSLTFGKNGKKNTSPPEITEKETTSRESGTPTPGNTTTEESLTSKPVANGTSESAESPTSSVVDQNALDDAIASEDMTPGASAAQGEETSSSDDSNLGEVSSGVVTTAELDNTSIITGFDGFDSEKLSSISMTPSSMSEGGNRLTEVPSESPFTNPTPDPPREFLTTTVHLPESNDPLKTIPRKIFYLTRHPFTIALIGLDVEGNNLNPSLSELEPLSTKVDVLFDSIDSALNEEALQRSIETIPSATRILQPRDRHIFSLHQRQFTAPSSQDKFSSKSIHLYNAQQLLESDHDIQEVFSRGQNPQHWHIGRQLGSGEDEMNGEVYMEVFRKETTLTDVDNVLAWAIRHMHGSNQNLLE